MNPLEWRSLKRFTYQVLAGEEVEDLNPYALLVGI